MSVQNLMEIHPISVEIFQSGPMWWINWLSDIAIPKINGINNINHKNGFLRCMFIVLLLLLNVQRESNTPRLWWHHRPLILSDMIFLCWWFTFKWHVSGPGCDLGSRSDLKKSDLVCSEKYDLWSETHGGKKNWATSAFNVDKARDVSNCDSWILTVFEMNSYIWNAPVFFSCSSGQAGNYSNILFKYMCFKSTLTEPEVTQSAELRLINSDMVCYFYCCLNDSSQPI